jgi:hypothetical protein
MPFAVRAVPTMSARPVEYDSWSSTTITESPDFTLSAENM